MDFFRQVGISVLDTLAYLGALTTPGRARCLRYDYRTIHRAPVRFSKAIEQAMEAGIRALPILSLITFFIGLILALQSAYELVRFGAINFVASAVAISMSRELGPLITAIIVIGRPVRLSPRNWAR